MKLKTTVMAIVIVALMIAAALGYNELSGKYAPDAQANENSDAAPDIAVYDADGNTVKLSDMAGKPVIINLWATWCGYCVREMPVFEAAYKKYGDDIEFMMVDLTDGVQETAEKAVSFAQQNSYTLPIYFDIDQSALYAYNAYSIPRTVLVRADGTLLTMHTGAMSETVLEEYIKELIE